MYDLVYPKDGSMKVKNKTIGRVSEGEGIGSFVTQRTGLVDKQTGEILPDAAIIMNVRKRVDAEHFIKIYSSGLTAIFDLSTTAQKVLRAMLIIYNEESMGDELYITHPLAKSQAGYPHQKAAWRSGLNELLFREFLMPSTRGGGWYWLNPVLFYRGDRMVIVNDYVKDLGKPKKLETKKPATNGDPELDQQDLFTGKTKRDDR